MDQTLDVEVTCALGVEGFLVDLTMENGQAMTVVLEGGRARVALPSPAMWARLSTKPNAGAIPAPDSTGEPAKDARVVDVAEAFQAGVPVKGVRLALHLAWDGRCHGEQHVPDEEDRFESWEHIQTAWFVGRTACNPNAPLLTGPWDFDHGTPLPFGTDAARFGEIICLAGDFYAHLDDEAAELFANAWPPLSGVTRWLGGDYRAVRLRTDDGVAALLKTIHAKGVGKAAIVHEFTTKAWNAVLGNHPLRRYLALASQNYCHFGSPDPSRIPDEALAMYRGYHGLALRRAAAAGSNKAAWQEAIITEAFACHFLSDLFASGHLRVPRRALGERFGVIRGALSMSGSMHNEDNRLGLWCRTRHEDSSKRVFWRAFGDGRLMDSAAEIHLAQVQEAVRLSVAEMFAANRAASLQLIPYDERAEALIPVPLPPGVSATVGDRTPEGALIIPGQAPNHWPMFVLLPTGHIGQRQGGPHENAYRDLEAPAENEFAFP